MSIDFKETRIYYGTKQYEMYLDILIDLGKPRNNHLVKFQYKNAFNSFNDSISVLYQLQGKLP